MRVSSAVNDAATGRRLDLDPTDSIVNGGPTLVRNGRLAIDPTADGVIHPADPSFFYGWGLRRNPRTMAGIDAHGRLLLVTVDGRQAGLSEGFSVAEGGAVMRALGAVSAINLDGGGSTAMSVNGALVSSPSDATGERSVGDAVVILPGKR